MTLELFGLARAIAGTNRVDLAVGESTTLAALVRALGHAHPRLIGDVIAPSGDALVAPNYVLLDGRRTVNGDDPIAASDRPCLLFLASGG